MVAGDALAAGGLAAYLIGAGLWALWEAPRAPEPRLAPLFFVLGDVLLSLGVLLAVRVVRAG